jgi:hypothetical protein
MADKKAFTWGEIELALVNLFSSPEGFKLIAAAMSAKEDEGYDEDKFGWDDYEPLFKAFVKPIIESVTIRTNTNIAMNSENEAIIDVLPFAECIPEDRKAEGKDIEGGSSIFYNGYDLLLDFFTRQRAAKKTVRLYFGLL